MPEVGNQKENIQAVVTFSNKSTKTLGNVGWTAEGEKIKIHNTFMRM